MLLSAVPKRLLVRRSRSLSPCRALYSGCGESSVRRYNVRELETAVSNGPVIFASRASRKCTLLGAREEACSSSGNPHAQYGQLASRWRTSLESRRSSWAALVTAGHTGSYRGKTEGQNTGEQNTGGRNPGAGRWRGAASAGILSSATLAFCFNRDNNNPGKH